MQNKRILLTGAAGFIGSNVLKALNDQGITNITIVDHPLTPKKKNNIESLRYTAFLESEELLSQLSSQQTYDAIIHLGARTDTTEEDKNYLFKTNTEYSKKLFLHATQHNIPFLYASSAAVYGDGSYGYSETAQNLKPLNLYGESKLLFDEFVLASDKTPAQWAGFRFFNVYGPNEYHKGKMASVVLHGFNQIEEIGSIRLFKSYREGVPDGEQKRDFIYVRDITSVLLYFLNEKAPSGIYNLGTGVARSFADLARATFAAHHQEPHIVYIDMPEELKGRYQYFTQADMHKLRSIGYTKSFYSLEDGVKEYVQEYLLQWKNKKQ